MSPVSDIVAALGTLVGLVGALGGLTFAVLAPKQHAIQITGYVLLGVAGLGLLTLATYYKARSDDLQDERDALRKKVEVLERDVQLATATQEVATAIAQIAAAVGEPVRVRWPWQA